jgi:DNA-binding transcriptional MerR regulator
MLAIGEFSRVTHLSVRTLRRYHEGGLLEPAEVDQLTGYRYYNADQIPTAQVIHRLRELDVPLPEVQRILRSPDPGVRATLVANHLQRLESELDRTRAAVASLRRLLQPEPAPLQVELRAIPAATVAAVEDIVEHDRVVAWYAGAMAELEAIVGAAQTVLDRCELVLSDRIVGGHVAVHRCSRRLPGRRPCRQPTRHQRV